LKLDKVPVVNTLLKPVDFGFKRSMVSGTESLACVFRDCCQTDDEELL